jgi:hypothetical protein
LSGSPAGSFLGSTFPGGLKEDPLDGHFDAFFPDNSPRATRLASRPTCPTSPADPAVRRSRRLSAAGFLADMGKLLSIMINFDIFNHIYITIKKYFIVL